MLEGLNKETLERLYIKEGKSTNTIAKMFGCASMTVWTRCKKYGIKTRTRAKARDKRTTKIKKSVLKRLYVREGKSSIKIAEIFSCSRNTIRNRCLKYGIKMRERTRTKGVARVLRSSYFDKEQIERLDRLSARTGVFKAAFVREGLDLVLNKYENEQKGRYKKREGG